jgi:hypothetical protein
VTLVISASLAGCVGYQTDDAGRYDIPALLAQSIRRPSVESTEKTEGAMADAGRRDMLKKFGKLAAAAPATMLLLEPRESQAGRKARRRRRNGGGPRNDY